MEMQIDQEKILEEGGEIFRLMESEQPAIFDRRRWAGELMNLAMRDPALKVQLFRFIDVFPTLTSTELVTSHLRDYFLTGETNLPDFMHRLMVGASSGLAAGVTAAILRKNILSFARTFIAGEDPADAPKALRRLWDGGRTFTVDILGEASLSEKESSRYQDLYLDLIGVLVRETAAWDLVGGTNEERFPRINISVKASSLYPRIGPLNYDDSVNQVSDRLRPIFRKVRGAKGFINVDMEMSSLKNITIDAFLDLLDQEEFSGWNGAGIALQAYLKETETDLRRLIDWARGRGRVITVRLVKGAYWEYETVTAMQKGWPSPVFEKKEHTDHNFETCSRLMLENSDCVTAAFGTHNVRSIAFVLAAAEQLRVPRSDFEFQMLYGMAEPIKAALQKMGHTIREYTPVGQLLPGMAYLVRRLLENTSNEGFLRRMFVDNVERERLLQSPAPWPGEPEPRQESGEDTKFRNMPPLDFSITVNRLACQAAIGHVRGELGRYYPVVIDGKEYPADEAIVSVNPARPEEVVGQVFCINRDMADMAVAAAVRAQPAWGATPPAERAEVLFRAAAVARHRRFELLSWQVLECGKNWAEADADVAEAIDFLEYYGREMLRLGSYQKMGNVPGEDNRYHYQPRGIGLVIAPWNFPLAISMGMTAAALVAGNTVLYKPSSLSAVNGWQMFEIFREAGLPEGVLNYIPGRGEGVGDYLVGHRDINFVAFTGSREVGLHIVELCSRTLPGQRSVKHAILEMGGKNAIIIDNDADMDQAVAGVVQSAYGYQGQKCSACSRAIVLEECYPRFVDRLTDAIKSIAVGPPESPDHFMGPVIDAAPRDRIRKYIEEGAAEGKVVSGGAVPEQGWYVPPTIVMDLPADSRLLQEEIFGPVLAIVKVHDMDEALRVANETDYALTGGLYSRSPANIERAYRDFQVGNLYVNRPITGAIVGRQPFGGFRMSGLGTKAGGPDYLLQFMLPRVVTENTMRRGFTPEVIS